MRRDFARNTDPVQALAPAARVNGTATTASTGVDLQGSDAAMVTFEFGAWTDGTHTPSLDDSTDGTTWVAVGTADMNGSLAAVSGTAGQNQNQKVSYIGSRRYLRAKLITAGATTGALSAATVTRSALARKPFP